MYNKDVDGKLIENKIKGNKIGFPTHPSCALTFTSESLSTSSNVESDF